MAFPQHVAKAACTLPPVVARHFISLGTTRYSSSLLYPRHSATRQDLPDLPGLPGLSDQSDLSVCICGGPATMTTPQRPTRGHLGRRSFCFSSTMFVSWALLPRARARMCMGSRAGRAARARAGARGAAAGLEGSRFPGRANVQSTLSTCCRQVGVTPFRARGAGPVRRG